MAKRKKTKRYEFRPDPTDNGLANKLYLSPQQRKSVTKWTLYSVTCLAALILQDTVLSRMKVGGGMAELAPAVIAMICVLEGGHNSSIFALAASILYVFSGTGQNPFCIAMLTASGILAAIFRQSYLRRGFSSDWLCAGLAMLVYELSIFCTALLMGQTYPARVGAALLTALFSTLVMPGIYPLLKRIGSIGGETWKE